MHQDFDYIAGKNNCTGDYYFDYTESSPDGEFDLLIFADSRGYFLDAQSSSWAIRLFRSFKDAGKSAMVVVRPKDQTGLFTLFNFLEFSGLKFKYAVCQIGLVEFFPKSNDYIQDLLVQKKPLFPNQELVRKALGKSLVMKKNPEDGQSIAEYEDLSSMDIDVPELKSTFVSLFEKHFRYVLLLGALELDPNTKFTRIRPKSFFDQIRLSNRFLKALGDNSRSVHYVELQKGWMEDCSWLVHDGAHYTANSHLNICETAKLLLMANVPGW